MPASEALSPVQRKSRYAGIFHTLDGCEARGWVCDLSAPERPVQIHVLIDHQQVATLTCDVEREDIRHRLGVSSGRLGFRFLIPEAFIDGQVHVLGFRLPDRSVLPVMFTEKPGEAGEECRFRLNSGYQFISCLDDVAGGRLRGWVQRRDPFTGELSGGCTVLISMDDAPLMQAKADRYRGDVAGVVGGDPECGFEATIPRHLRRSGEVELRVTVLPEGRDLEGSPLTVSMLDDRTEEALVQLSETVDALYREIATLRTQMNSLLRPRGYDLGGYDRWARAYYAQLRVRVAERRELRASAAGRRRKAPLVSIICPVYRPLMSDFVAAVESVLAQTWQNWELIIVDDGAKSPEVSEKISEYCRADRRIRAVTLRRNKGISGATNAGLKEVRGDWVAFFDHDDLLVDVAIETMLQHAEGTSARVLYSDEDKIDADGIFSEPNLKPDFDYRYLLGCNYVCHLTMVRTDTLAQAGELRTKYDGAQDHDLLLRLTEIVPASGILHVPEILYHWRKTPNSTAVTIENKEYAVEAGVSCVRDHLKRRKKPAEIGSVLGMTLYSVRWLRTRQPKVSVIIPFRDQPEVTQECLRRLLTLTDYPDFEVILVDNWSVEPSTQSMLRSACRDSRVRVLRAEEEFNFSRLNNRAAEQSDADYFFFMNNDLFVEDESWLSRIVSEAEAGDRVAAVGGKYLYPNGRVQHVGVAVGPEAIAVHVHKGLPGDQSGYVGHAILTHEVTAVTGAGMLVRAEAFRAVGGFDEENLRVAYNDVDLCLKLRSADWKIIQCNEFVATHHESLSRGSDDQQMHEARFFGESQYMREKWAESRFFARDPAYSRFFSIGKLPYHDLRDPLSL
ncbi:glycosyltransferase family 2 protein [Acetobacter sp. AN02]|uniref:glycosyltransferase family 2 protein n=1 Tax=Acetobacter sp. AN02 TaxID=2894186 RepID=UPI0024343DC6|nr:glycosyltransferase family 2 protein [Acetobacter sp. AN02]MDG6094007.1 glycosyltransferase family 2 protein [Acetobacter sp. AN02]